nr:hypothetical protein [Methylobacterium organophilum]
MDEGAAAAASIVLLAGFLESLCVDQLPIGADDMEIGEVAKHSPRFERLIGIKLEKYIAGEFPAVSLQDVSLQALESR